MRWSWSSPAQGQHSRPAGMSRTCNLGRACSPGDPGEIAEGYRNSIQTLTARLAHTDLVTIAAVNGAAVGAGFDLAIGCDLRIGSTKARFAHTFAKLGILPGDGGAWLLPRVVGWQTGHRARLHSKDG